MKSILYPDVDLGCLEIMYRKVHPTKSEPNYVGNGKSALKNLLIYGKVQKVHFLRLRNHKVLFRKSIQF